jgi:hypothetical protein
MNNEKMTPSQWASMDYGMATNFGTGYSDNFPRPEDMTLENLLDQVNEFQYPFSPETYKDYDGWEEFDDLFEQREFTTIDKIQYFNQYREEVRNGVVSEYLSIFESNIESIE